MTRFRLVLEYHGTEFVGWQVQPNGRSVQGVLQAALAELLGHETHVAGSGRTDAGVHALGQVAAFDTTAERTERAVMKGLNSLLPPDVACLAADVVDPDFDPRRQARRKLYRYTFLERPARSPMLADRVWHLGHTLDVERMHEAARLVIGRHDFASFRAAGCASTHPIRTVEDARVRREGDLVYFEIVGNGFLRHMVRILAGTLYSVGTRKIDVAGFQRILSAADRKHLGKTAPPQGLTLVYVEYVGGEAPSDDEQDD